MAAPAPARRFKRRRASDDDEDDAMAKLLRMADEAEEYVTVAERREQAAAQRSENRAARRERAREEGIEDYGARRAKALEAMAAEKRREEEEAARQSLLDAHDALAEERANMDATAVKVDKQESAEEQLLREANQVSTNALMSKAEIARGARFTESLETSWRAPRYYREKSEEELAALRKKWHIIVEGETVPPPIRTFREMKMPRALVDALAGNGIKRPTPIQVQGLPVAFSGRDMIGIAFTGSGKTITFSLPAILHSLEEEMKLPVEPTEGPVAVILCPSRELARQTYEVCERYCGALASGGWPKLRSLLVVGGESKRDQIMQVEREGVHIVVATPGRLKDLLNARKMNLNLCKYLCLDEGDRMLDLGFDEEVQGIINHFTRQRQTLLFSATMPQKFQDFAKNTLVRPVLVNVGRAGAANLDVIQEVEYVKSEAKIVYLLECLQKTAPPVCIFCERKGDVDDIHEYLLLKGVAAVSIHGGKDQAERTAAIEAFKRLEKDVLVATDIAAKGLDFPDIQHVINFDMPEEIENYVHRIGRTGRCGRTGVATTFINKNVPEPALLDLKHLLVEAKQRVPPVLLALDDPDEDLSGVGGVRGCSYCGGLGHRITDCPKLDKTARQQAGQRRDMLRGGGGYGAEM
uniref:RNA helicase n=1 Tax=Phaeomonas parva TaxID=124430 RepID=A0A7S1XQX1_9STRA|eukprot:CAMPEP_0118854454 /NCGR_PEP_ID=MMETSP1163-20130328/2664_1 /TAXON_ID=124430 /ORGANISM="Phaeomonas parva, Strain CCMP2877" /LENGTH=638 /DNA_ID=CAMNT_0006787183 /DNA_START=192 /DNA_END=2108 /DNA_ORIENTATION=-